MVQQLRRKQKTSGPASAGLCRLACKIMKANRHSPAGFTILGKVKDRLVFP